MKTVKPLGKEDQSGQTQEKSKPGIKVVVNIFKLEGSGEFPSAPR